MYSSLKLNQRHSDFATCWIVEIISCQQVYSLWQWRADSCPQVRSLGALQGEQGWTGWPGTSRDGHWQNLTWCWSSDHNRWIFLFALDEEELGSLLLATPTNLEGKPLLFSPGGRAREQPHDVERSWDDIIPESVWQQTMQPHWYFRSIPPVYLVNQFVFNWLYVWQGIHWPLWSSCPISLNCRFASQAYPSFSMLHTEKLWVAWHWKAGSGLACQWSYLNCSSHHICN